jgi:hypothetical protein
VAPLVFKTSLGIVRSSEGSTPSLLRQQTCTVGSPRSDKLAAIAQAVRSRGKNTKCYDDSTEDDIRPEDAIRWMGNDLS